MWRGQSENRSLVAEREHGSSASFPGQRSYVCFYLFLWLKFRHFCQRRLCAATRKLLVSLFGFENSEKRCGVMPLSESDTRIAAGSDGRWGGENIFVSAILVETGWERGEGIARRSLLKKQGSWKVNILYCLSKLFLRKTSPLRCLNVFAFYRPSHTDDMPLWQWHIFHFPFRSRESRRVRIRHFVPHFAFRPFFPLFVVYSRVRGFFQMKAESRQKGLIFSNPSWNPFVFCRVKYLNFFCGFCETANELQSWIFDNDPHTQWMNFFNGTPSDLWTKFALPCHKCTKRPLCCCHRKGTVAVILAIHGLHETQ